MHSKKLVKSTTDPKTVSERYIQLLLFFLLLGCFTYFFPRWADWSQNSRLNLILAIVDQQSLSIDAYMGNTGDYARYQDHYYSDKAPGPAFLGVPVYAAVRPILQSAPFQSILTRLSNSTAFGDTLNEAGTGLQEDKLYYFTVLMIVVFFTISIPAALLGVLLYRFLRDLGTSPAWAVSVVVIYGLASNAFPYSWALYSHQLSAFLLFGAFYLGFLVQAGRIHSAWVIAAGVMLGYSLISEYPTFLIALGIFIYIVATIPARRWITGFIAGGVPPGILLMAYNWAIFRTPLPVGYRYSELYVEQHSVGLISLSFPTLDALWGITFSSYRGLFFVSPVLLLAVAGLIMWWRWGKFRKESLVCIWAVLSFLLFNASSVMWQGGYSIGPRYLVPMLPFLMPGFAVFIMRFGERAWARLTLLILAILSLLIVWTLVLGGQSFPDWTANPLFNYSLPHLLNGNIARNWGMALGISGWWSLAPLLLYLLVFGFFLKKVASRARSSTNELANTAA
jgi:hypothetical protein